MRLALLLIGLPVAVGLSIVSMIANWRFGVRLGAEDGDAFAYGLASVCADGLKIVLPFAIARAWSRRRVAEWLSAAALWLVITLYSFVSALSFAAVNRAEIAGRKSHQGQSYEALRADLVSKRAERKDIGTTRASGAVAADLRAVEQHSRFHASQRCEAPEGRDTRQHCERYHGLAAELATARKGEALDAEVTQLRDRLERLPAGATGALDPQVDLFKELSGLTEARVKAGLALLVCVLIELGSGLGLYVVLSAARAQRDETTAAPTPSTLVLTPRDEDWADARLQHTPLGMAGAADLYADYRLWMEARGRTSVLTVTAFGRWMSDLGLDRDKVGGRIVYRGVELKAARLALASS